MSEDSQQRLRQLRASALAHPDDPAAAFRLACALDGEGYEREAIPQYERALGLGLCGDDREAALINLGSSYRAVGEYARAVAIWRDAVLQFPENRALPVFLAMGLHNLGQHAGAAELLLRQLAETSGDAWIARYRRAILFYADKLDRVWPG